MMQFWYKRRLKLGNQKGFTLIELMIVIAIIGILAAIAIPLYSNMQARARVAKATADLRGLYSALAAFNAHCGDSPNATVVTTAPAPITFLVGTTTCALAIGGDVTVLGEIVTDAQGVPAGPFYTGQITLPGTGATAWTYEYAYAAGPPATWVLSACNVSDLPGCANVAALPVPAGNTVIHFP